MWREGVRGSIAGQLSLSQSLHSRRIQASTIVARPYDLIIRNLHERLAGKSQACAANLG